MPPPLQRKLPQLLPLPLLPWPPLRLHPPLNRLQPRRLRPQPRPPKLPLLRQLRPQRPHQPQHRLLLRRRPLNQLRSSLPWVCLTQHLCVPPVLRLRNPQPQHRPHRNPLNPLPPSKWHRLQRLPLPPPLLQPLLQVAL